MFEGESVSHFRCVNFEQLQGIKEVLSTETDDDAWSSEEKLS